MQRTRSMGLLAGPNWSIGSSATRIRPSGVWQTTEGTWILGFSSSTSSFQSGDEGEGVGSLGSSFFWGCSAAGAAVQRPNATRTEQNASDQGFIECLL